MLQEVEQRSSYHETESENHLAIFSAPSRTTVIRELTGSGYFPVYEHFQQS